ncbi:hypothetical protein GBA52_008871 [Prunus armeniaca]|nr:hypothetical protein GBA52_008871 [Prunus armeniaca]
MISNFYTALSVFFLDLGEYGILRNTATNHTPQSLWLQGKEEDQHLEKKPDLSIQLF